MVPPPKRQQRLYGTPLYAYNNKLAVKITLGFTLFGTVLGSLYYFSIRNDPFFASRTPAAEKREHDNHLLNNYVQSQRVAIRKYHESIQEQQEN